MSIAGEHRVDEDLAHLDREALIAEVQRLRAGIREHRDSSGQDLCWHHPQLWGLLPEKSDPLPRVPAWPEFLRGCVKYRESLDREPPNAARLPPTQNKTTVETYMDGFRTTDRGRILSCLTDDVEWLIPGAFHARGKEEFARHIVDEGFVTHPTITVTRLMEDADVVVAEGSVRTQRKDGAFLNLAFCDVFEMQNGRIRRLISYLMEEK